MKSEKVIVAYQYADPEHEAVLDAIMSNLLTETELRGKHDGAVNKPVNTDEHKALILSLIEITLQDAVNINKQKYLPISGMVVAKAAENEANKIEHNLQSANNEDELLLTKLTNEANGMKPDVKLIQIRNIVLIGLAFMGIAEGFLSYNAFRYNPLPVLPSIIASIAIAFGTGIAAHFSSGFIKEAKSYFQSFVRYSLIIFLAGLGFYKLGCMRANQYNDLQGLQLDPDHLQTLTQGTVSAISIAVISLLLFMISVFVSSRFYRTTEERNRERAYGEKCNEIAEKEKAIKDRNDEIKRIRDEKIAKMTLALKMFEYALYQEQRIITFAQVAAEKYKQKNMRRRSDGCPAFFSNQFEFNFSRFFNSLKP